MTEQSRESRTASWAKIVLARASVVALMLVVAYWGVPRLLIRVAASPAGVEGSGSLTEAFDEARAAFRVTGRVGQLPLHEDAALDAAQRIGSALRDAGERFYLDPTMSHEARSRATRLLLLADPMGARWGLLSGILPDVAPSNRFRPDSVLPDDTSDARELSAAAAVAFGEGREARALALWERALAAEPTPRTDAGRLAVGLIYAGRADLAAPLLRSVFEENTTQNLFMDESFHILCSALAARGQNDEANELDRGEDCPNARAWFQIRADGAALPPSLTARVRSRSSYLDGPGARRVWLAACARDDDWGRFLDHSGPDGPLMRGLPLSCSDVFDLLGTACFGPPIPPALVAHVRRLVETRIVEAPTLDDRTEGVLVWALFEEARAMLQTGRTETALRILERLVRLAPNRPSVRALNVATKELVLGPEAALATFESAALPAEFEGYRLHLLVQAGRWREARALLTDVSAAGEGKAVFPEASARGGDISEAGALLRARLALAEGDDATFESLVAAEPTASGESDQSSLRTMQRLRSGDVTDAGHLFRYQSFVPAGLYGRWFMLYLSGLGERRLDYARAVVPRLVGRTHIARPHEGVLAAYLLHRLGATWNDPAVRLRLRAHGRAHDRIAELLLDGSAEFALSAH